MITYHIFYDCIMIIATFYAFLIFVFIMPYAMKKMSARRWRVYNKKTGKVYAYNTTLKKAKSQLRLLHSIEAKN